MNEQKFEELLRQSFAAESPPPQALQQKLRTQLEKAEEKELSPMKKTTRKAIKKTPLLAAVLCLTLSVTALAARHFLRAADVAEQISPTLSAAFSGEDALELNLTRKQNGYLISLLGITSGAALPASDADLNDNSTYAVVAISREDGTPLEIGSTPFFVSPLIQGLEPWKYNIASMGGGYQEFTADGVLYRLIECDDIRLFADHTLYLCVLDTMFYDKEAFLADAEGYLSENPDYAGLNVLFTLPLDAADADPVAAQAYIDALWSEEE